MPPSCMFSFTMEGFANASMAGEAAERFHVGLQQREQDGFN